MSKLDGFSQYTCDRCQKVLYASPDSPQAQSWKSINRISSSNSDINRILCPECAKEYRELVAQEDADFTKFMNSKVGEK